MTPEYPKMHYSAAQRGRSAGNTLFPGVSVAINRSVSAIRYGLLSIAYGPSPTRSGSIPIFLALLLLAPAAHAVLPAPAHTNLLVVLKGEPCADVYLRLRDSLGGPEIVRAIKERRAEIQQQQDVFVASIGQFGGRAIGRFHRLLNAVRIQIPLAEHSRVAAIPGVQSVLPATHFRRQTATSVPFIGAGTVWNPSGLNATGKGISIGIIDSGIDYTHADFGGSGVPADFANNDATIIEPGTFPTAKVVGGFDFVGDAYDADDPNNDVPKPDPDPLDCGSDGHGTHVAGIAAGYGVTADGKTYTGPYTTNLAPSSFKVGPGVAPEALLYALKVFGCTGTTLVVLDALDWATDPNDDNDYSDHLDVLNLSLGSPFGLTGAGDIEQSAINKLVDLGAVVVVSGGNAGDTFYILGSPGSAEKAITVAASIDQGTVTKALQVESPAAIAGLYTAVEGAFTVPLASLPALTGEAVYVQPTDACSDLADAADLTGKVALIDRGDCLFVDKVQRAQQAGAIAVVMVNNVPGDPITMGGTPGYTVTIPGVMISQADGARIKAHLGEKPVLRLASDLVLSHSEYADELEPNSSRGPALPSSLLKPDIAAPGFSISSARAGSGTDAIEETGTSMAAPHIAGAAALLRQLRPDWPAADIKSVLMNTAVRMHDRAGNPCPESQAGAGRVQVDKAALTFVTAKAAGDPGSVTLNFGAVVVTNLFATTRDVTLKNFGSDPVQLAVTVTNQVSDAGIALLPATNVITVPALGTITLSIRLQVDPSLFQGAQDPANSLSSSGLPRFTLGETSGQIWFQNQNTAIHLPYYASLRPGTAFAAESTVLGVPAGTNDVAVGLHIKGASAHPFPLVSVFQLGFTNSVQSGLADYLAPANLLAVGIASDAISRTEFDNATIFFALATAADWATPGGFQAGFTIEVDTNFDAVADYRIVNRSAGNSTQGELDSASSANDSFMPVVTRAPSGEERTNYFTGWFPPGSRDTALFNNSVLVLPVPVRLLDLDKTNAAFQFRILSTGPLVRGSTKVDQTPWISFNPAQPLVDPSVYGITNSPFSRDGEPVRLSLRRSAAREYGYSETDPIGVLLLHHSNPLATRFETVFLKPDNAPQTPLAMLAPQVDDNGKLRLRWTSNPGRLYRVLVTTDLATGFTHVLAAGIVATPPVTTFTDESFGTAGTGGQPGSDGSQARFYRVQQE